jgi:EmrB/QacA subfamily drug resistance transporter
MPATLSIITNVFPARERGRAIGVWAATAGVAVALGPLIGGLLLQHFYWGSVFLVNLPIVAVGLLAGVFLIPNSKDPHPAALDPAGAVLSIAGLAILLYGIIEAPSHGWSDPVIVVSLVVGAVFLATFAWWELHIDHPMLNFSFFKNPRFSAGSAAITLTFLAMFGSLFLLSQYLQFVLGYTPLQTGVRLLAFAIPMMVIAPLSARFVERFGTKLVVAAGMAMTTAGLIALSFVPAHSGYAGIAWQMVIMASGLALTMAPATDSIMGSLPLAKAGVGSAVNDTTRQVGGALGVAVLGSIFTSIYGSQIAQALNGQGLPPAVVAQAKDSVGGAMEAAATLGGSAGALVVSAANSAFIDGFHAALRGGALVTAIGFVVTLLFLPAHARTDDVHGQANELTAEHPELEPDVVTRTQTVTPTPSSLTLRQDIVSQ